MKPTWQDWGYDSDPDYDDDEPDEYNEDWYGDETKKSHDAYVASSIRFDLLDIAHDIPFAFGNVLKYSLRAKFKGQFLSDRSKAYNYAEVILNNKRSLKACEEFMHDDPTAAYLLYRLMDCPEYEDAQQKGCLAKTLIEHALKRLS